MMERNNFGYEYRYQFWLDDDIIPRRPKLTPSAGEKTVVFEMRINFMVRTTEGVEEILGSEILNGDAEETNSKLCLQFNMADRLYEYWLPIDGVERFIDEAVSFAKQKAAAADHGRDVIPVVVGFDVCTLQMPGEAVVAVRERAIRPEYLVPKYLVVFDETLKRCTSLDRKGFIVFYLRDLVKGRIRVEDVDEGIKLMNVCDICGRQPTLGALISHLNCNHAFHTHCVVNWMVFYNTCPTCGVEDHTYPPFLV